jgi:hypothetical protein
MDDDRKVAFSQLQWDDAQLLQQYGDLLLATLLELLQIKSFQLPRFPDISIWVRIFVTLLPWSSRERSYPHYHCKQS